jgi:hypothetical protein
MSERPKDDADPDATVMLPSGGARANAPDEDATVMIPAPRADDDATVMIPAARADDGRHGHDSRRRGRMTTLRS